MQLQLFPTKTVLFKKNGITVTELNHAISDEDGYNEYIISNGTDSFSSSNKPVLEEESLKKDIQDYLKERHDSLDTEPVDRPITND